MTYTNLLIPLVHISNLFNLPSDITNKIYSYIVHNSAQLIIDKWFSYVTIHNTNLSYIANRITLLEGHTLFGETITYYNLSDKNFFITLYICVKYIKPSISDKQWWKCFAQNGYNGLIFIHDIDYIALRSLELIDHIFSMFSR